MNHDPYATNKDAGDALENGILDALRHLPSEQGAPSAETDAAILRMASATMARIRRRVIVRRVFWGVTATAACLALAMLVFPRQAGAPAHTHQEFPAEDPAAIILREVSALFPGQIQSIQRDASGLQLSLADTPTTNPGPAVVLDIRNNGDSREIISFDGQTIEIMGHRVTIHTRDDGRVILKGPGIEWLSDQPKSPLPDLHIRARLI